MLDHHKVDPIINAPLNVHFLIIGLLLQPSPHGIWAYASFPHAQDTESGGVGGGEQGDKKQKII